MCEVRHVVSTHWLAVQRGKMTDWKFHALPEVVWKSQRWTPTIPCSILNYSYHAVHEISRTYLSYKWNSVPFDQQLSISYTLQSLATTIPFSDSIFSVTFLDSTHKWDHAVFVFPCLAYFT